MRDRVLPRNTEDVMTVQRSQVGVGTPAHPWAPHWTGTEAHVMIASLTPLSERLAERAGGDYAA